MHEVFREWFGKGAVFQQRFQNNIVAAVREIAVQRKDQAGADIHH